MAFAIMRCQKKASMGAVARSLKHCYREQDTPNADPARTPDNTHGEAGSTGEAMGRLRELLPEKRRKDAVICVEYMMTASPEWWKDATPEQQQAFFERSRQWLADKYGEKNIITATIHKDETTPHLSAFVVPITKDGRLSAKEFIGNKSKMSADQTSYAERVADLGLERGVKGSRARHETIRQYYARVNEKTPQTPRIDVPEPSMKDRLNPSDYGHKVANSVLSQIEGQWKAMAAKANLRDAAEKRADDMTIVAKRARADATKNYETAEKYLQTSKGLYSVLSLFTEKEREERIKQAKEQQEMQRQDVKVAQKEPEPVQKPPEKPKERDIER